MFLPQRSLQTVTFLAILFFACFAMCQDLENRRAVTEHQLMHDKGRAVQGLKRLQWLQHALGAVHTASSREMPLPSASREVPLPSASREMPLPSASRDVQESQDPSDSNSSDGDEASSLVKL
ncbi:PTH4 protein, partial [Buphagus erythrorhynchus]|nr:PTH4 protein [Buphagus erythrorhynchus]